MYIFFWIVCGIGAAAVASSKGRSPLAWLALGLLLGPIAILIVGFMAKPGPDKNKLRKCPYCAETILKEATVCKHCGREVPMELVEIVRTRKCPHCGRAVPFEQLWCPYCKQSLFKSAQND